MKIAKEDDDDWKREEYPALSSVLIIADSLAGFLSSLLIVIMIRFQINTVSVSTIFFAERERTQKKKRFFSSPFSPSIDGPQLHDQSDRQTAQQSNKFRATSGKNNKYNT